MQDLGLPCCIQLVHSLTFAACLLPVLSQYKEVQELGLLVDKDDQGVLLQVGRRAGVAGWW